MQIYNNLGENSNQFVVRTTETNKDGIHLIITKSKLASKNEPCGSWLCDQRVPCWKGELSKEREAKLNLLGDWVTSTRRRKVKSIERKEEAIKDRKPRT